MFGENILSKIPAKWNIENGIMTAASISLDYNGKATQKLTHDDLQVIPSEMAFYCITDHYVNSYEPFAWASLYVIDTEGTHYSYILPINNTGNNICKVSFTTSEVEFQSCTFSLFSKEPVIFSEWILSAPVVDINLEDIREEIPRMLADFNTFTFTVSQREETIALISSRLIRPTDVGGKLQITFVASQACEVTIRLKDNTGTELFAPLLYEVPQGRSSIGVPHAYLKRLSGVHTFTATAQCTQGNLTFYTRSILYVIDAGHLAQRILDIGMHVMDIAIQQKEHEHSPSYIWAIGRDPDQTIRVRRRLYDEANIIVWEPIYSLEEGIDAAIEFNGYWFRRTGEDFYTIYCQEIPWIFLVTPTGTLYGQIGDEEDTRIILSEGVSQVTAIRGYKSEIYIAQDQGLIVAYIKAGQAYYRSYCIQSNGTYIWEIERSIPQLGNDLVKVHVHRLNDYRVGFVGTTSTGQNKWIYTTRTYVTSAMPPENFNANYRMGAQLMAIFNKDIDPYEQTEIETWFEEDYSILYARCNFPFIIFRDWRKAFIFTNNTPQYVYIKEIEFLNEYTIAFILNAPLVTLNCQIEPIYCEVAVRIPSSGLIDITHTAPWIYFDPKRIDLSTEIFSASYRNQYLLLNVIKKITIYNNFTEMFSAYYTFDYLQLQIKRIQKINNSYNEIFNSNYIVEDIHIKTYKSGTEPI